MRYPQACLRCSGRYGYESQRKWEKRGSCEHEVQKMRRVCENAALLAVADALTGNCGRIHKANGRDVGRGTGERNASGMVDRLRLTEARRWKPWRKGLRQIAGLPDPLGEVLDPVYPSHRSQIEKRQVPLGVIGIIYESRPNVTADTFGLCFKGGECLYPQGREGCH